MEPVIVGWGHTSFGKLGGPSLEDLIQEAEREALQGAKPERAK